MIAKRYSYRFNPRCRASRPRYWTKNAFAMFNRITSSPGNNVAMPVFVQSRPRRASKNAAAAAAACLRCHHRHPRSHCFARPACRPCERACSADHRPLRHPRQLCSGAARARSTIVVIATVPSTCSRPCPPRPYREKFHILPHDVHACAKRRTHPRRT